MNKYIKILILIGFGLYIGFIFLSKINYPLMSYDEAWYASIAQNMLNDKEFLYQNFNGEPYFDHPPLGFWLMALSLKILPQPELASRLPSVLAGIGSLIILYILARERSKTIAALIPPIMLGSSMWYVYRVRSANLESLVVFFFILTVFTVEKLMANRQTLKWIMLSGIAMAGLILTKTLVGLGIVPALAVIFITSRSRKVVAIKNLGLAVGFAILICLPWYYTNYTHYPNFVDHHFLTIGTREGASREMTVKAFEQTLLYFRSGVGKWYYPSILAIFISFGLLLFKKFRTKYLLIDLGWFVGVGVPFLLSPKTEVWHLIPLYVPVFLLIPSIITASGKIFPEKLFKLFIYVVTIGVLLIAVWQVRQFMPLLHQSIEFDRKDIALKARDMDFTFNMKAAFLPAFVYYSGKDNVKGLWMDSNSYGKMTDCLKSTECKQAFVIDYPDLKLLTDDKINFIINASNSGYLIVSPKP